MFWTTTRAVGQEQMFRIGVRFISATASRSQVGKAYSDLADTLIGQLYWTLCALKLGEKYGETRPAASLLLLPWASWAARK